MEKRKTGYYLCIGKTGKVLAGPFRQPQSRPVEKAVRQHYEHISNMTLQFYDGAEERWREAGATTK